MTPLPFFTQLSIWPELFESIGHNLFFCPHMVDAQQMFMK